MTDFLRQALLAPLGETFFIKSLVGGMMTAVVCGVVGCLVILRKMSFLGDALSHAMLAGVAGGYLFMKLAFGLEAHAPAMLVGSVLAAVLTVGLIGFVSNISRIKEDTAIGIIYTGVFAAGVVLVSAFSEYVHIDLMHFIMGDVLGVADADLWVAAIAGSIVLSVIILFFRFFHITSFDPILAAAIGIPVGLVGYALTVSVSLVVVSAVSMVGVILVVGLLITPAATAYLLSDRLEKMMLLSALFGVSSVVGGLYLCVWFNTSGGGAIMLFCTIQFLVVLFVAPRYGILAGWFRRRRQVPQQVMEDVLGFVLRQEGAVTPEKVTAAVTGERSVILRALRQMLSAELLSSQDHGLGLTEKGRREALKLLRAHRLWEAYLHRTGVAPERVHEIAHQLEHLNDPDSVHLMDHLLGHPLEDPHGSRIPAEVSHEPGKKLRASELRPEERAAVLEVTEKGRDCGLQAGDVVICGPRRNEGRTWVLHRDKEEIHLEHRQADAVWVAILGGNG
ncbi:MAG: metal ABC transporter permease [Acidobacteria bacterium]|nr:metal ABC transporter permease [Acidobacteriota bacterium]